MKTTTNSVLSPMTAEEEEKKQALQVGFVLCLSLLGGCGPGGSPSLS